MRSSPEIRFAFGKNWRRFLEKLDGERIQTAEGTLVHMLGIEDLKGKRFLDVGSGSGLFSLAARRLGAVVHSLDYDADAVACTRELRQRYFPGDADWTIEQASALDEDHLKSLEQFDVVYSWGVLHHTGDMWKGLANMASLVAAGGQLFIAIYNDGGGRSRRWRAVKKLYNELPRGFRFLVLVPCLVYVWTPLLLRGTLRGRPFGHWRQYRRNRGMSAWHDLVDWVGGYPYEVAKPEEIFDFYRNTGFQLEKLRTKGASLGCNEFVFRRVPSVPLEPAAIRRQQSRTNSLK